VPQKSAKARKHALLLTRSGDESQERWVIAK
jgi:hypothetical protein